MFSFFREINRHPSPRDLRAFGGQLCAGFPVMGAVFLFVVRARTGAWPAWPLWLAAGGVAVGLFALLAPPLARPLYLAWHFLSAFLAALTRTLALALVFYGVLTPIGLLLRLCGRDPMHRRFDRAARSYWREAPPPREPRSYFRQS